MSAINPSFSVKGKNMGLFNFGRKKQEITPQKEERGLNFGLSFNNISSYSSAQSMRLSAVYSAVNQISNSCALLPVLVYKYDGEKKSLAKHNVSKILNRKPNGVMTHYNFFKQMIESVMLRGEAFAYIERDERLKVKALHYIDADNVTVVRKGNELKYIISGQPSAVDAVNMIHLYQHIDYNTMRGISVIKYASMTLANASDAEKHSSNFFKSGANLSGIIKANATLTNEQKKQIRESWSTAFSSNNSDVSVAILPSGMEYQPISISPEDAQLLDSRKYEVIEIARFFNISPVKLFDLTNSSYNSLEHTQLSYMQDTIYPYVRMMMDEFNTKLFTPSEQERFEIDFDFSALLETDKNTQASYYKTLLVNGIMSLNEVREHLDLPRVDNGDVHFIQLNMTSIDSVIEGKNLAAPENDNKVKQQVDDAPVEDENNEIKEDKE